VSQGTTQLVPRRLPALLFRRPPWVLMDETMGTIDLRSARTRHRRVSRMKNYSTPVIHPFIGGAGVFFLRRTALFTVVLSSRQSAAGPETEREGDASGANHGPGKDPGTPTECTSRGKPGSGKLAALARFGFADMLLFLMVSAGRGTMLQTSSFGPQRRPRTPEEP